MRAKDVGRRAKWRAIDALPPSASRKEDGSGERKHWIDTPKHPIRYFDSCPLRVVSSLLQTAALLKHYQRTFKALSRTRFTIRKYRSLLKFDTLFIDL